MAIFVAMWVVQMIASVLIMTMIRDREELSPKIRTTRKSAIALGFAPCGGFMLLYQAFFMIMYLGGAKVHDYKDAKLQAELKNSNFGKGFGGLAAGSRPSAAVEANPFGSDPAGPAPPASNPFISGPSAPAPPPDNPFG